MTKLANWKYPIFFLNYFSHQMYHLANLGHSWQMIINGLQCLWNKELFHLEKLILHLLKISFSEPILKPYVHLLANRPESWFLYLNLALTDCLADNTLDQRKEKSISMILFESCTVATPWTKVKRKRLWHWLTGWPIKLQLSICSNTLDRLKIIIRKMTGWPVKHAVSGQ